MEILVQVDHLSKSYGNKVALKDVCLTIPTGKIIGLLGKNGSGKSTLIKLINGLLRKDAGTIKVSGYEPGVETKRLISYLPERTYLDRSQSVQQILTFFQDFYPDFNLEKAKRLIQDLGLDLHMKISSMSKGMQEKLQLILVMSRNAKLYILDEPLGGVDPSTRDYILDTILTNFSEDASILISTHLIFDVERILDDVIFVDQGVIQGYEEADRLRTEQGCSIDTYFRRTF